MGELIILSGVGVPITWIPGHTIASFLYGTDTGVLIGAFAGAVVYVLSATELSRVTQVGYFLASFFIGILAADMTTGIINSIIGKYLPSGVMVSKSIGATVAAAIGICVLILLGKLLHSQLPGGKNDTE